MAELPSPTVRQVAETAGVHFTTVSKILRGKSRASLQTRERVLVTARQMGYHPNPLASAWMAQRRAANPARTEVNFGFIFPNAQSMAENAFERQIRQSLHARAETHGYAADDFALDDYASLEALARVLNARGIKGLVWVGTVARNGLPEGFKDCAMCCFGGEMVGVPTVRTGAFEGVRIALKRLSEMGKRRPALVLFERPTDWNLIRYEAGFRIAYQRGEFDGLAPVVLVKRDSVPGKSQLRIIRNADAILTNGSSFSTDLLTVSLDAHPGGTMGIDQRRDDMAAIAVDQVSAALLSPARLTDRPQADITVTPRWIGATSQRS